MRCQLRQGVVRKGTREPVRRVVRNGLRSGGGQVRQAASRGPVPGAPLHTLNSGPEPRESAPILSNLSHNRKRTFQI